MHDDLHRSPWRARAVAFSACLWLVGSAAAQSWTDPVPLTTPGENDSFLGPIAEEDGDVRVLNVNIDLGDYTLRSIGYDAATDTWGAPEVVVEPVDIVGAPDFVREANGDITVLYRDGFGLTDRLVEVRYDAQTDVWTSPRVIFERARTDNFDPPVFEAIELAQDATGRVIAVIDETNPSLFNNLSVLTRDPNTGEWSGPDPVVTGPRNVVVPTLVSGPGGVSVDLLYAVSTEGPAIRHRSWDAGSGGFAPETTVPGTDTLVIGFAGPSTTLPAVADAQGRVTVVWDSEVSDSPSVRASRLAGGAWSSSGDLVPPFDDNSLNVISFGDIKAAATGDVRFIASRSESEPGLARVAIYSLRFDAGAGAWQAPELVSAQPTSSTSRVRIAFIGEGPEAIATHSAVIEPPGRQIGGTFFDGESWGEVIDIPQDDLAFFQELAYDPATGRVSLVFEETAGRPDSGIKAAFFLPPDCPADLNGDDVLDLDDVQTFIAAFVGEDPIADLAAPLGVFDLADVQAFVASFNAGCP